LHCAAQSGANTAVATLLAASADTNKADAQRRTALATAVYWGQSSISTIETLLSHTTVEWTAPRIGNLIVAAVLARKSTNRARVLERILEALRAEKKRKAPRIVRKLMPELVQEMLVSAGDDDCGSPADVMPLLLEFLPQNDETRHVLLSRMLIAVVQHGGDDNGELARSLLLLDESNATEALPGMWGLQHLACKYGRLKTLRVLVAFGLSPLSRVDINRVPHTPLDIAKEFSPGIVSRVEDLLKGIEALMRFRTQPALSMAFPDSPSGFPSEMLQSIPSEAYTTWPG
jgi:ankyrin repeat protein